MNYYQQHIFFCCNQRADDKKCCGQAHAQDFSDYAKKQLKRLDLYGPGKIRISKSGCLGRCALGPVLVIYPEGIWYTYSTKADIDEIIHTQLQQGQRVKRLLLDPT